MAFEVLKSARKKSLLALTLMGLALPTLPSANVPNPQCFNSLRKERATILEKFGKLQNSKTFSLAKARILQKRLEKYLIAIGDVLENYNVEIFLDEQLEKIPRINKLNPGEKKTLREVLTPSFEGRKLPSLSHLEKDLQEVGLGDLPARKIRDTMDTSFRIWRTRLVFDEMGKSTYNKLAKNFIRKQGLQELSMQIGLLAKNKWEAFFEGEKVPGQFNMSLPGLLNDIFGTTEAHESVHMVVETLAAKGRESPYAVFIKVDKKYKKTGALGNRQKRALALATDPLNDGDYYRNELYLDELPAHVIQSSFLNVELSKALRQRFDELKSTISKESTLEELERVYADTLRGEEIHWNDYSRETQWVFEKFIGKKASDHRTQISKILSEMNEYVNWVDLINDGGSTGVFEARKILDQAIIEMEKNGLRAIHPTPKGPIQIKPDFFLGKKGYRIEVRVPVDLLQKDKSYIETEQGATVIFRFSGETPTKNIGPEKIKKLLTQTNWVSEIAEKIQKEVQYYAEFLDESGELKDYSIADVFKIKRVHTRLRQINRDTLRRIRASK